MQYFEIDRVMYVSEHFLYIKFTVGNTLSSSPDHLKKQVGLMPVNYAIPK